MYRQARYDEPCIFEMGRSGTRGHLVPRVETEIKDAVGDGWSHIPANMRRNNPPGRP